VEFEEEDRIWKEFEGRLEEKNLMMIFNLLPCLFVEILEFLISLGQFKFIPWMSFLSTLTVFWFFEVFRLQLFFFTSLYTFL
jgi:hypothetical protein